MIVKCGIESVVGSGFAAVGGRTVREVMPVVSKIREVVDSWEHVVLDDFLSASPGHERWLTRPVYIELVVNDEVLDPRRPWDTRTKLFESLLGTYRHYRSLMIVAPVTYRGFYIGGSESHNLKERLDKRTYRSSSVTIEVRRGKGPLRTLKAYVYDFGVLPLRSWLVEDTYDEESEWFRAARECVCSVCGREYREHPRSVTYSYLNELCSGQLVKL